MISVKSFSHTAQVVFQQVAMLVFAGSALGATVWSMLAMASIAPWPGIGLIGPEGAVVPAGPYLLAGIAFFGIALMFFLPTSLRVQQLENSHRQFTVRMEDVARAYHAAHAADRAGLFRASAEFDGVRERLVFLRKHPDLGGLEPEVLELAAQMSRVSQELAQVYSDENVSRAQIFLQQRQQEIDRFNTRLDAAKAAHARLKTWQANVSLDEDVAESQLARLRAELAELLPDEVPGPKAKDPTPSDVIRLPLTAAE